ncbi:Biotin synthase [hydrothermal vent metagenome]|uniref:biotin synthase n=1 Tax=hydrothermal vent metagenome TaxID=652676 RepID=A0A3B0XI67_9ZZZZ
MTQASNKTSGKAPNIDNSTLRHDWSLQEIENILQQPFNDLLFKAHTLHRQHHNPNEVQISSLLSIKTGACAEDCGYCSQSAKHNTELERERLLPLSEVIEKAKIARNNGSSRFCMGAAWRNPTDKNLEKVIEMVQAVKETGMETCVTLGMLSQPQSQRLKEAGLDYYNHNLDTSPEFYGNVITTRTFQDRLDTLQHVRDSGINVCSGGILGMGENSTDRASMLQQLANMAQHPESVPINMLVQIEGTPLYGADGIDSIEFVRSIAAARTLMPQSQVRLSAGRHEMTDEMQALCFFAGANSIFYGDKLLTTENCETNDDLALFNRLGIKPSEVEHNELKKAEACHS